MRDTSIRVRPDTRDRLRRLAAGLGGPIGDLVDVLSYADRTDVDHLSRVRLKERDRDDDPRHAAR